MSFTATVENGTIKLPPDVVLPNGTEVRIEPVAAKKAIPTRETASAQEPETFGEAFKEFFGIVKDGPGDRADNHDHYLYGTPKRVP